VIRNRRRLAAFVDGLATGWVFSLTMRNTVSSLACGIGRRQRSATLLLRSWTRRGLPVRRDGIADAAFINTSRRSLAAVAPAA
jgi:hypothetical protein